MPVTFNEKVQVRHFNDAEAVEGTAALEREGRIPGIELSPPASPTEPDDVDLRAATHGDVDLSQASEATAAPTGFVRVTSLRSKQAMLDMFRAEQATAQPTTTDIATSDSGKTELKAKFGNSSQQADDNLSLYNSSSDEETETAKPPSEAGVSTRVIHRDYTTRELRLHRNPDKQTHAARWAVRDAHTRSVAGLQPAAPGEEPLYSTVKKTATDSAANTTKPQREPMPPHFDDPRHQSAKHFPSSGETTSDSEDDTYATLEVVTGKATHAAPNRLLFSDEDPTTLV